MIPFYNKYQQEYPETPLKMIIKKLEAAVKAAKKGDEKWEIEEVKKAYEMLMDYLSEKGLYPEQGQRPQGQPQNHFYPHYPPMYPFFRQGGQSGNGQGGTK